MHIEKTTSAGNATKQKQDCLQSTAFSLKSRPVFAKRLLAVYTKITRQGMSFHRLYRPISGNPDSGIPEFFAIVIRNTAQRFWIPTNDRNLKSKFHWQRLESRINGVKSRIQDCLGFPCMGRPIYPALQAHAYDPTVLLHTALMLQLRKLVEHSLISPRTAYNYSCEKYSRLHCNE